jgi:Sec-independent protein translocase protein TatA
MRSGIFFILLLVILFFGPGPFINKASAMGPAVNAVRPEEEKLERQQDGKNRGENLREENSSESEKDSTETEEPSSRKGPRIKYRDMFECSC